MSSTRRRFTVEQKAAVVRRHLAGKTPVSDLADEFKIQPSQIHTWVKQVLDRAEAAFVGATDGPRRSAAFERNQQQRIAELELKLARKNEVISELMEANLQVGKAALTIPGTP